MSQRTSSGKVADRPHQSFHPTGGINLQSGTKPMEDAT